MSKITVLNEKAWCAEIPDWSKDWYITNIHADNDLICPSKYEGVHWIGRLPDGEFLILGRPEEMTEEQWKGIVELITYKEIDKLYSSSSFKNHNMVNAGSAAGFNNATQSGLSLLKSKGLNPSEVIILIKNT